MKRYVRCSEEEYYTNFIDENIPESVKAFLESGDSEITYDVVKDAVTDFKLDYDKFPGRNTMAGLSSEYDRDKKRFYNKYLNFAKKCKIVEKMIRPTGYGRNDYRDIRIRDLLRYVDHNFPYGWKYF